MAPTHAQAVEVAGLCSVDCGMGQVLMAHSSEQTHIPSWLLEYRPSSPRGAPHPGLHSMGIRGTAVGSGVHPPSHVCLQAVLTTCLSGPTS